VVTVEKKPVYVMVSGDVKAASLRRLGHFSQLDLHHLYQRTRQKIRSDDTTKSDFHGKHTHYRSPIHLYRLLTKIKPDIVQGPEPFSLLMMLYLLPVFLYIIRHPQTKLVVVTLENIPLASKYHRFICPFFRIILKPYFERASVIFWFVPGSKENLLAFGAPKDKLVNQIYGTWGVDLDFWSPVGETYDFDHEGPTILYVGRLVKEKGVDYLIQAFKLLRDQGINAHLAIIGDGPERTNLLAQAKDTGYDNDITFFGLISHQELPPYFRGAKVLVNPFYRIKLWWEQWANVIQQALACGLPVITSDTPSMRELVAANTGLFAPEKDADELANHMATILSNSALQKCMKETARKYAKSRFNERRNLKLSENTILTACGYLLTK
jgi:glycosyltransferase involved in cell wall biosynthesis